MRLHNEHIREEMGGVDVSRVSMDHPHHINHNPQAAAAARAQAIVRLATTVKSVSVALYR